MLLDIFIMLDIYFYPIFYRLPSEILFLQFALSDLFVVLQNLPVHLEGRTP